MNEPDWWQTFDEHCDKMRALVEKYHPTSVNVHDANISAHAAERMCAEIRAEICRKADGPGIDMFDAAAKSRDVDVLTKILNDAWFGMPESMSVRDEPGFFELCDLCEGIG